MTHVLRVDRDAAICEGIHYGRGRLKKKNDMRPGETPGLIFYACMHRIGTENAQAVYRFAPGKMHEAR